MLPAPGASKGRDGTIGPADHNQEAEPVCCTPLAPPVPLSLNKSLLVGEESPLPEPLGYSLH